ncbi:Rgp1-domain-containing protein [Agrocybe pediades]|nr:Rgp1-domain-containing protein [Agrocybe pediades]
MPGTMTTSDASSPVRVVVTPSQSSYFAGEPFSVTITFTNTRSPTEAGPSKASFQAHKRGAHSISSAPLARPPTSPGTPRSALAQQSASRVKINNEELPRRKGFIGKAPTEFPDLIEQRRKRQLAAKSLSVSLTPKDLEDQLAEGVIASSSRTSYNHSTIPQIPSPLTRTASLGLASDHPHARKQSVLDGQLSLDVLFPTTNSSPAPYTPTSSTSTFSLALDPIAEAALSPYPSTPAIGLPTIEQVTFTPPHTPTATTPTLSSGNSVYAYPPPRNLGHGGHRRPTPIGLGQPSNSPRGYLEPPRTAFASTFAQTNNELILYSYAQLTGTVVVTPVSGILPTHEQAHTLNAARSALLNRSVLGGGSMDITSSLNTHTPNTSISMSSPKPRHGRTHSRSSSFSAGLISLLSPSTLVSSMSITSPTIPNSPLSGRSGSSRWRAASGPMTPKFPPHSASSSVTTFGNFSATEEIDPEEPLPTFEIQPAMLAVDLSLAPGESRSYTYTVRLPENLPPTFKGKALKFSYELVVGTCRAGPSGSGGASGGGVSANSISRVMKVPVRVYNYVAVGRSLKPYDLLWPVGRRQDAGMPGWEAKVKEEPRDKYKNALSIPQLPSSNNLSTNTLESIQEYARSLLASLPEPVPSQNQLESPSSSSSSSAPSPSSATNSDSNGRHHKADELRRTENERERVEEVIQIGCREAVEILTRNPKKASYDVNKDGVKVAVLTFPKTAYRLGETVIGIVELNDRTSRARVLKLSAFLEAHESLPSTISPTSSTRHLRRTHAESHSSFTLNTLRTTFSLDIPSDASPAFQVRVGTPANPTSPTLPSQRPAPPPTPGGLEWKVRICLLVGVAAETSQTGFQGVRFKSLVRDGPRGEWGSSWKATERNAPMEKPDLKAEAEAAAQKQRQLQREKEKEQQQAMSLASPRAWSRFIVSSLLYGGSLHDESEREYHDGDVLGMGDEDGEDDGDGNAPGRRAGHFVGLDDEDGYDGIIPDLAGGVGVGVDYGGGEEGWREVKLETVECEVPVKVFPGNTAFKAVDIVFDV